MFVGDGTVQRSLAQLGREVQVLPPELDLGPRLIGAVRDAMEVSGGDRAGAGPIVQRRVGEWAEQTACRGGASQP
jgi:hypothetical protein